MAYKARCACGALTATITADPIAVAQCWCQRCQKIACGGPTHNAQFLADAVDISGDTREMEYLADSGNMLTQHFCPNCGTHAYSHSSARPQVRTIRFGFLEAGHGLKPQAAIWTSEAPNWALIDPELTQVAGQPAPPPIAEPGD